MTQEKEIKEMLLKKLFRGAYNNNSLKVNGYNSYRNGLHWVLHIYADLGTEKVFECKLSVLTFSDGVKYSVYYSFGDDTDKVISNGYLDACSILDSDAVCINSKVVEGIIEWLGARSRPIFEYK